MKNQTTRRVRSIVMGVTAFAALAFLAAPLRAADAPASVGLRVAGARTVMELGPTLYAVQSLSHGSESIVQGGVPSLYGDPTKPAGDPAGKADVATNAEAQVLNISVKHPDVRIIMTTTEGLYRIVYRKSRGIHSLADLKGKKIATYPSSSASYYVHSVLATAHLTDADFTIVPFTKTPDISNALIKGDVDAICIWEPEISIAQKALGKDAGFFQPKGAYREIFDLNTTAEALADPVKRKKIVALVKEIQKATRLAQSSPQKIWPLVSAASGYSAAAVAESWPHLKFRQGLAPDLLDVMVAEEASIAKNEGRPARGRDELKKLIDPSILAEAAK